VSARSRCSAGVAAERFNLGPIQTFPLHIDIPITLEGVNPTLDFAADLDLLGLANQIGQSFTGDFKNSADLSFTTPPRVTVVSASGVFPGTVPEPGTLALAATGLAAAGILAIGRKTRQRSGRFPPGN
jgi:hypothetical protein